MTNARHVSAARVEYGRSISGLGRLDGDWRAKADRYVRPPPSSRRQLCDERPPDDHLRAGRAVYFSSLQVGDGSRRVSLPPVSHPAPPTTYWVGDSYVAGGGSTYPGFDDLAHLASIASRAADVTVDALGGTGYARSNSAAAFPPYLPRQQLPRRPPSTPPTHRRRRSIDDAVFSGGRVRHAAAALYAYLRHALPEVPVVVVTFASSYPTPRGEAQANAGDPRRGSGGPQRRRCPRRPSPRRCAHRRRRDRTSVRRA